MVNAFVLIDIRHEPQPIDLAFMEWMGKKELPFSIVFTKADKLSQNKIESTVQKYLDTLLAGVWEEVPPHFVTSSSSGLGRDELLSYIEKLL
jgi:GTP-binding protein